MSHEDGLVREQIDYYNRRATKYDATSTPEGDALESQGLRLEEALRDFVRRAGCSRFHVAQERGHAD